MLSFRVSAVRNLLLFVVALAAFLLPARVAFVRARHELVAATRVSVFTFIIGLVAYAALAAGVVLTSWLSIWLVSVDLSVAQIIGGISLVVGALVYLTARLHLRSFRATWGLANERLITSGIYRFVRHPQNLGWGLLLLGMALLGRSGGALLLVGAYVLACVVWLPVEEAALQKRFGAAYTQYRERTSAWIPFR